MKKLCTIFSIFLLTASLQASEKQTTPEKSSVEKKEAAEDQLKTPCLDNLTELVRSFMGTTPNSIAQTTMEQRAAIRGAHSSLNKLALLKKKLAHNNVTRQFIEESEKLTALATRKFESLKEKGPKFLEGCLEEFGTFLALLQNNEKTQPLVDEVLSTIPEAWQSIQSIMTTLPNVLNDSDFKKFVEDFKAFDSQAKAAVAGQVVQKKEVALAQKYVIKWQRHTLNKSTTNTHNSSNTSSVSSLSASCSASSCSYQP